MSAKKTGKLRRSLFDLILSDKYGKMNDNTFFWGNSDPNDIQKDTDSTKKRVWRYYSNPLTRKK